MDYGRKNQSRRSKKNRGFTLLGLMATVGILVVLFAVSIPAAASIEKNLEITRLDSIAREIYVASQNRMTHLNASGGLKGLCDIMDSAAYSDHKITAINSNMPKDYEKQDVSWKNLYFTESGDSTVNSYILPAAAIEDIPGNFIIELSQDTGLIYSVFYSEKADRTQLLADYSAFLYSHRAGDGDKAARRDYTRMTGYYGGGVLGSKGAPTLAPQLTAVNGEELYLDMVCEGLPGFQPESLARPKAFTVKVVMTDQHGNKMTKKYTADDSEFTVDAAGNLKISLLLDSMREGYSFGELTENLTLGDTITAKATVACLYEGDVLTTNVVNSSASVKFNSLFANGSTFQTLKVNRVRHLKNLDGYTPIRETGEAQLTRVEQTGDIEFDDRAWDSAEWCSTTAEQVNPLTSFTPITNKTLFGGAPENGNPVVGTVEFDGQGNEIKNFVITQKTDTNSNLTGPAGLFVNTNCDISNVMLRNTVVTGKDEVGPLAGHVYGGTITGCGSYHKADTTLGQKIYGEGSLPVTNFVSGTGTGTGGLIGVLSAGDVADSFGSISVNSKLQGTEAGGFIGDMKGGTVTNCYSSGEIMARQNAGGFIGRISAGTVTGGYTTSNVTANLPENSTDTAHYGCFAGLVLGGTISDGISYGRLVTDSEGCGAFATQTAGTVSDCKYLEGMLEDEEYNIQYDEITGATGTADEDLIVSKLSVRNTHPYLEELDEEAFPYEFMAAIGSHYGNWPVGVVPQEVDDGYFTGILYYEKYTKSGSTIYGYYGEMKKLTADGPEGTSVTIDTLKTQKWLSDNGYTLVEDGYAMATDIQLKSLSYTFNGTRYNNKQVGSQSGGNEKFELMDTVAATGQFEDVDSPTLIYRLPLNINMVARSNNSNFYYKLSIDDYVPVTATSQEYGTDVFFLNPHVAKESSYGTSAPSAPANVIIRSARQLNYLGRAQYYWNSSNSGISSITYKQELDIDFAKYTSSYCGITGVDFSSGTYANVPIGSSGSAFKYTYNGDGYVIRDYNVTVSGDRYAGLFGDINAATLKNIHMVASYNNGSSGGKISSTYTGSGSFIAVGGLVAKMTGNSTVQNCSISGYDVSYSAGSAGSTSYSASNGVAVGGLIGVQSAGKVSDSTAVNHLNSLTATAQGSRTKSHAVGGLIGSKNGGQLEHCYAGGDQRIKVYSNATASGIGGVTGPRVATGESGLSNTAPHHCYSYSEKASGCSGNYKYYGCIGSGVGNATVTADVANCYFLGGLVDEDYKCGTDIAYGALKAAGENYGFTATRIDAAHSFNWSPDLDGYAFPSPPVVKNAAGDYVHYGDWPSTVNRTLNGTYGVVACFRLALTGATIYACYYNTYENGVLVKSEHSWSLPNGVDPPSTSSLSRVTVYCCAFWKDLDDVLTWTYDIGGKGNPQAITTRTGTSPTWSKEKADQSVVFHAVGDGIDSTESVKYDQQIVPW